MAIDGEIHMRSALKSIEIYWNIWIFERNILTTWCSNHCPSRPPEDPNRGLCMSCRGMLWQIEVIKSRTFTADSEISEMTRKCFANGEDKRQDGRQSGINGSMLKIHVSHHISHQISHQIYSISTHTWKILPKIRAARALDVLDVQGHDWPVGVAAESWMWRSQLELEKSSWVSPRNGWF